MAFSVERKRLGGLLNPGEVILASDVLGGIVEMPELSMPPVLVVSDKAIYIILSGREKAEYRIEFGELLTVARRTDPFARRKDPLARAIMLVLRDGGGEPRPITCLFHWRDHRGRTGDLITERFFGRVVKDTTDDGE